MTWADTLHQMHGSPEIVKRTQRSLHLKGAGNSTLALCVGKPLHYQDGSTWLPIDPTLRLMPSGKVGAPGVPVEIDDTGAVYILGTEYSQWTSRVGVFTPSTRTFASVFNVPRGSLQGHSLIAEGATWRVERRLTEDGLREELTLLSRPNVSAVAGDYLVLESQIRGFSFPNGEVGEFEAAGHTFPFPVATDANGAEAPCRRYTRVVSGIQRLYTGIPVSWLANAVYPVVLDPDFAGGTADGFIYGQSTTYATAQADVFSYNATNNYTTVGQDKIATNFQCLRSYCSFDTSAITTGNTVTQANLKLTPIVDSSTTDFDVQITKSNWTGTWATQSNRDADYDLPKTDTLDDNIWRNTNGISINTQYTSGNLAVAWVNRTGLTKYGLISSRDRAGTQNTGTEYVRFATAEHATEAYRPVLTVLYEAVAGAPVITSLTPDNGPVGTSVVIAGTSFGAAKGAGYVRFYNQKQAQVTAWADTEITAVVPPTAATGNATVTDNAGIVSNGSLFTVTADPGVSSLSPNNGPVGSIVLIFGQALGSAIGTVTFNGTAVTSFFYWTNLLIAAYVPTGATTGPVVVTLPGNVQATGTPTFTVTVVPPTPAITSITPNHGPEGASITIVGTDFEAARGLGDVTFNGVSATAYTSWADTQIVVAVPTTATSGLVYVRNNTGNASNGVAFTVETGDGGGGAAVLTDSGRRVALVEYAVPAVIPSKLLRVGFVATAPASVLRIVPTWVASPDQAPKGMTCWGAVRYTTLDLVPEELLPIAAVT